MGTTVALGEDRLTTIVTSVVEDVPRAYRRCASSCRPNTALSCGAPIGRRRQLQRFVVRPHRYTAFRKSRAPRRPLARPSNPALSWGAPSGLGAVGFSASFDGGARMLTTVLLLF